MVKDLGLRQGKTDPIIVRSTINEDQIAVGTVWKDIQSSPASTSNISKSPPQSLALQHPINDEVITPNINTIGDLNDASPSYIQVCIYYISIFYSMCLIATKSSLSEIKPYFSKIQTDHSLLQYLVNTIPVSNIAQTKFTTKCFNNKLLFQVNFKQQSTQGLLLNLNPLWNVIVVSLLKL